MVQAAQQHPHRVRLQRGEEVRLDVAIEAPLVTQHVGQQFLVFTCLKSVDEVVRTHHGSDIAILHRHFERQQVELVQDPPVDGRLQQSHAIRFLLVGREMLGHRDDPLGLDSLDLCDRHRAREVGIFAEVLEIAPQDGEPGHVDARRFEHV